MQAYPEEWVFDDEGAFENALADSENDDLLITLYLPESALYSGTKCFKTFLDDY